MADNRILGRTYKTPLGYSGSADQSKVGYDKIYVGFVKEVEDPMKIGKLKVWIPELSGDPNDSEKWFWVKYVSPFAGATPIKDHKNSTDPEKTQQSYGWWGIVPDIDNEVVVAFANGDPGRGMIIGYLYQEYMNKMVPGIPSSDCYQMDNTVGQKPPVKEYNKWSSAAESPDPMRPRFEPLHKGLMMEGLYKDKERGPSLAGARNGNGNFPRRSYGVLSPKGQQIYINEEDGDAEYIRIRTKGGTQVLVNENNGYVYINSKNGDSWIEISDVGIDVYSKHNITMRAQKDINLHADKDINLHAGQTINTRSNGGPTRIHAYGGNLEMRTEHTFNLQAVKNGNILTGKLLSESAGGVFSMTSNPLIVMNASRINQNCGGGNNAEEAEYPELQTHQDTQLSPPEYPHTEKQSIVSRFTAHEPWAGHQKGTLGGNQAPTSPVTPEGPTKGVGSAGTSDTSGNKKGGGSGKDIPTGNATPYEGDPNELGSLSKKYESNGNPGAIGHDSTGGWSYGEYQIATKTGTMDNYMEYLKVNNPEQYEKLQAAGGAQAARNGDPKFKAAWKELAKDPSFSQSQHGFIKKTHYDVTVNKVSTIGLDVNTRSKALQDAVWSTSVQHGSSGGAKVINNALGGRDPNTMSDEEIINAIYDERSKTNVYFPNSTSGVKNSVKNRFSREKQDALARLRNERRNQSVA